MLAVALWSVNAACASAVRPGPASDPAPWTAYLGEPGHAPSVTERLAPELAPTWRVGIAKPASGPPAVGRSVVAVLSFDRHLSLIDLESGDRMWRVRLNATGVGGPRLAGDRVFAATGGSEGRVYAVALANGSALWRTDVGPVAGPLASLPDLVVAATERGRVVALSAADGEILWQRRLDRVVRSGATPLGDRVFVATDDSLFVLDAADGEVVYRTKAPGVLLAPPAVQGDTLYLASPDGFVAAVAAQGLGVLWRVEVGDPVFASPAIARGELIAATLTGALWRVPLAAPERASMVDLDVPVRAAPAPLADGVLVGTVQGEVLFAPTGGGGAARRVRVDGPIEQQPIVRNGMLLVIDGVGGLHAWK